MMKIYNSTKSKSRHLYRVWLLFCVLFSFTAHSQLYIKKGTTVVVYNSNELNSSDSLQHKNKAIVFHLNENIRIANFEQLAEVQEQHLLSLKSSNNKTPKANFRKSRKLENELPLVQSKTKVFPLSPSENSIGNIHKNKANSISSIDRYTIKKGFLTSSSILITPLFYIKNNFLFSNVKTASFTFNSQFKVRPPPQFLV